MVSIDPVFSNFHSLLSKPSGTVQSALTISGIIGTLISTVSSKLRRTILSILADFKSAVV